MLLIFYLPFDGIVFDDTVFDGIVVKRLLKSVAKIYNKSASERCHAPFESTEPTEQSPHPTSPVLPIDVKRR